MPALTTTLTRYLCATACSLMVVSGVMAAPQKFRISVDTNPSHVRNKGIEIFVAELQKHVGDSLAIEVYPSAQLFRDRDIP